MPLRLTGGTTGAMAASCWLVFGPLPDDSIVERINLGSDGSAGVPTETRVAIMGFANAPTKSSAFFPANGRPLTQQETTTNAGTPAMAVTSRVVHEVFVEEPVSGEFRYLGIEADMAGSTVKLFASLKLRKKPDSDLQAPKASKDFQVPTVAKRVDNLKSPHPAGRAAKPAKGPVVAKR